MKKVVILGAGFAGLHIFYTLRHLIGKKIEVTLVNPTAYSLLKPSLPEVALDGLDIKRTHISIKGCIEPRGAKFIEDEAIMIDPDQKRIHLRQGELLSYDTLFIAMGAIKDYDAIEGFREYGYSVCDDHQAQRLWQRLQSFQGGTIVTGSAKSDFSHTRIRVPELSAPCEGPVGEVMFMAGHYLKHHRHLSADAFRIEVFSPAAVFFEDVGEVAHQSVGKLMEAQHIGLHTSKVLSKITQESVYFEDGSKRACDLAIIIPPYKAPKVIKSSHLGDANGFIPTDTQMRHLDHDSIYAAGDITELAQPKLGHIAIIQAEIAAKSFLKDLGEETDIPVFDPEVFCIMNMGGTEAILINDNTLYGGTRSIAFHSPLSKAMKWEFDSYLYFNHGHMPPDWALKFTDIITKRL